MAQTTTTGTPTIGAVIRAWRVYHGLNVTQLAARAGVRKGYLSDIEHDKRTNPLLGHLEKLAVALEISLQDIQDRRLPPGQGEEEDDQSAGQGPQAISPPAHAPLPLAMSAAVGAVLQQLLAQMQTLTATVSHLQADLADLKQRTAILSPAPQLVSDPVVHPFEALPLQEFETKVVRKWEKEREATVNLDQAPQWEEDITKLEEQAGGLLLVMYGFQGITVPQAQYVEQLRSIPKLSAQAVDLVRMALTHRKRRRVAFTKHVKKDPFLHIMPIKALESYRETGFHSPDSWPALLKGKPANLEQQARHIRFVIRLLKKYENYHIGLLTGEEGERDIYERVHWEVKGGHTLLVEDFTSGERDTSTQDRFIVYRYSRWFKWLWERSGWVITDKEEVIRELEKHIELLKKSYATS